jgi:hypothetical protein
MIAWLRVVVRSTFAIGILAACSESVTPDPVKYGLSLSPAALSLALGGSNASATINATVTRKNIPDASVAVQWSSSDTTVATIVGQGQVAMVVGHSHGVASITASVPGSSATTVVTVVAPECVFSAATPRLQFGVAVTAQLSKADCRRNNLSAKVYRIDWDGSPGYLKVVMNSSSFNPRLTVLNSSLSEAGVSGAVNSACLSGFSLFVTNRIYYVVASGPSDSSQGTFTILAINSESNAPCSP